MKEYTLEELYEKHMGKKPTEDELAEIKSFIIEVDKYIEKNYKPETKTT